MANVTLNISGDSQEVIAVIRALAQENEPADGQAAPELPAASVDPAPEADSPPPREHSWTAAAARDTRSNVSSDAQRLLDALIRAPDHQMHIDDIYSELELDRYGLIGARRSISAALRRNAATADVTLLSTRDRRVTLDGGYAQAMQLDATASANPMSRWGQLPQYT